MRHTRIRRCLLLGLGWVLAGCAHGPQHAHSPHSYPATLAAHHNTAFPLPSSNPSKARNLSAQLSRNMNEQPHLARDRVVHLSPHVREQPLTRAIAIIPYDTIRNFLESPHLIDEKGLSNAPYIVSIEDRHLIAGNGATIYVHGVASDGPRHFAIVHPGSPYRDSRTHEVLGRKALPVGRVTIHHRGNKVATATIDRSQREARPGDRLLPIANERPIRDFHPHLPEQPITAHIISVFRGVSEIGQYDVVTLDRGRNADVERGDMLGIFQPGHTVPDPVAGDAVSLPEIKAGQLMIFKVNDKVSFGLIMHATKAIHVDDVAHTPDAA